MTPSILAVGDREGICGHRTTEGPFVGYVCLPGAGAIPDNSRCADLCRRLLCGPRHVVVSPFHEIPPGMATGYGTGTAGEIGLQTKTAGVLVVPWRRIGRMLSAALDW
ncbi:hypothetical protein RHA1_ro00535 [Rhodococcus jostii RHA1]|uniref:Uncharacterized protein n=1 Tax=Rhodococcus jostii (strain RHA1) TaxID=101510 RepID=Q0SJB5_RHOJR|nr:hypothetical protein RHA1_ro00535 [Rhodococcus jostii RHA1]